MKQNKQELINKATLLYKEVYRFAYSRTKDEEAAKDIAQTVMGISIAKMETLKKSESLKQWIMQITSNRINEYFRELQRYKEFSLLTDTENEDIFDQVEDTEADILQSIVIKESQSSMVKALLRLEIKYQNIIRLHLIYEVPLNKIAEQLNINYNTVKTRYVRGIKQLRELFLEIEKGGDDHE